MKAEWSTGETARIVGEGDTSVLVVGTTMFAG